MNKDKEKHIAKFSVSGLNDESWKRIQDSFFLIIDKISKKIEESSELNPETIDRTSDAIKDITAIAAHWAKAKIEKPTLENEKLKAEIAEKFANTKKILAETEKIEMESHSLKLETNHKAIKYHVEQLEMMFNMMNKLKGAHLSFGLTQNTGSLFIGANPDEYSIDKEDKTTGHNTLYK